MYAMLCTEGGERGFVCVVASPYQSDWYTTDMRCARLLGCDGGAAGGGPDGGGGPLGVGGGGTLRGGGGGGPRGGGPPPWKPNKSVIMYYLYINLRSTNVTKKEPIKIIIVNQLSQLMNILFREYSAYS